MKDKNTGNVKKKIAIASDAIYPYNKGGKEKRIYEISTRLVKKGHDVHIYCMKWWKGKENDRIENGVHLHAISKFYHLYSGKRRSIKEAIMFSIACFKLIKEDFDVIDVDHMPHLVLFSTKFVCLLKRKKLIATWNEVWGRKYWQEYLGKLGMIAYIVEWLSTRMPDRIISISEYTKLKLINDLKVKKEIYVIPNGIDIKEIQGIKPSKNKSDIIFAGRLLKHKNVDLLIKSVSILRKNYPKIVCFIVGEGPEKNNLVKLVQKLHFEKNIKFFDFLEDHNELYAFMKSSKVFVLPSMREGFGIVVLEANTCGIPVVTINHPDNAAKDLIINKKNGLICDLDGKSLSMTIKKLLDENNSKEKYIKFTKNYDWINSANRIEEVYQK